MMRRREMEGEQKAARVREAVGEGMQCARVPRGATGRRAGGRPALRSKNSTPLWKFIVAAPVVT